MYELNIVNGKLRILMGHTGEGDRVVLVVPASRVYVAASRLAGRQEVEFNIRCPKGSMKYEIEPKPTAPPPETKPPNVPEDHE